MPNLTMNGRPTLTRAPRASFAAPNGVNDDVSAATDDLAFLAGYFIRWWDRNLERVTTCHGWRATNSTNPKGPQNSNHLSATAWDVNGGKHLYELYEPARSMYRDRSRVYQAIGFSQSELDRMRKFSKTITDQDGRRIFRLGIDFDSPFRDPMHFELAPGITDKGVAYAANQLRLTVDGNWGAATTKALQRYFDTPVDGKISEPSTLIRAMQKHFGTTEDGVISKPSSLVKAMQEHYGTPTDGLISDTSPMVKAMQRALNDGKI